VGSPPGYEPIPGREPEGKEGGRLGVEVAIFLFTVLGTGLFGLASWAMFANPLANPGETPHPKVAGGVVFAVLAGACLIGGLRWTVRVRTGHGRHSAHPIEGGSRRGAGMADRRAHPVAAFFIFGLAHALTLGLAAAAGLVRLLSTVGPGWTQGGPPTPGETALVVMLSVLAVVCFLAGQALRLAWRPESKTVAPLPGRSLRVGEPGANLIDPATGEVMTRLSPGAKVIAGEVAGQRMKVTTEDGRTGWVDQRSVF